MIGTFELVVAIAEMVALLALAALCWWLLLVLGAKPLPRPFRLRWRIRGCNADCTCECTSDHHNWTDDDYAWCAELGHGAYP